MPETQEGVEGDDWGWWFDNRTPQSRLQLIRQMRRWPDPAPMEARVAALTERVRELESALREFLATSERMPSSNDGGPRGEAAIQAWFERRQTARDAARAALTPEEGR